MLLSFKLSEIRLRLRLPLRLRIYRLRRLLINDNFKLINYLNVIFLRVRTLFTDILRIALLLASLMIVRPGTISVFIIKRLFEDIKFILASFQILLGKFNVSLCFLDKVQCFHPPKKNGLQNRLQNQITKTDYKNR